MEIFDIAYWELYEENGITDKGTELIYLVIMVYYQTNMKLEIFGEILNREILREQVIFQVLYQLSPIETESILCFPDIFSARIQRIACCQNDFSRLNPADMQNVDDIATIQHEHIGIV